MIIDSQTNFVYFSSLFEKQFNEIYTSLCDYFDRKEIKYGLIENTKDIWARDYMPIQISKENFIQFKFEPSYLKGKMYEKKRTKTFDVCKELGVKARCSNLKIDGGNIVKGINKVIATTKIFKDNGNRGEEDVLLYLKEELKVHQVVIIPQEPGDLFGHADGMVRFIDDKRVLVNNYSNGQKNYEEFKDNLHACLRNAGLEIQTLVYTSWRNKGIDATGCYINYLEVGSFIFAPVFGISEDMFALNQLEMIFTEKIIVNIDCRTLAKRGGLLNCISWNVLKNVNQSTYRN